MYQRGSHGLWQRHDLMPSHQLYVLVEHTQIIAHGLGPLAMMQLQSFPGRGRVWCLELASLSSHDHDQIIEALGAPHGWEQICAYPVYEVQTNDLCLQVKDLTRVEIDGVSWISARVRPDNSPIEGPWMAVLMDPSLASAYLLRGRLETRGAQVFFFGVALETLI